MDVLLFLYFLWRPLIYEHFFLSFLPQVISILQRLFKSNNPVKNEPHLVQEVWIKTVLNDHLPNGFTGNQPIRAYHLYLWTDNGADMSPLIHWLRADSTVDSCAGEWIFTKYEICWI